MGYGVNKQSITETTVAGPGLRRFPSLPSVEFFNGATPKFDYSERTRNGGAQFGEHPPVNPTPVTRFRIPLFKLQGANGATEYRILSSNTRLSVMPGFMLFPSVFSNTSVWITFHRFCIVCGCVCYTNGSTLFIGPAASLMVRIQRSGPCSQACVCIGGCSIYSFAGLFNAMAMKVGWTVGAGIEAEPIGGIGRRRPSTLMLELGIMSEMSKSMFFSRALVRWASR